MHIEAIPAFNDNYIWLLTEGERAWVVDPGDSQPVLDALKARSLELAGILLTHHHGDHTGGVEALRAAFPQATVYGNSNSPASKLVTVAVADGDRFDIANQSFDVLAVPGHTLDHLAFYSAELQVLFCGDTLFIGGCGRVFEGTYEQMYHSLQRLARLPADTQIYCAHEYTLANLHFAVAAMPESNAVKNALAEAELRRADGQSTVPGLLSDELATNPFLCVKDLEQFTERREWKNNF